MTGKDIGYLRVLWKPRANIQVIWDEFENPDKSIDSVNDPKNDKNNDKENPNNNTGGVMKIRAKSLLQIVINYCVRLYAIRYEKGWVSGGSERENA